MIRPYVTLAGEESAVSRLPCSCLCSCWSATGSGCLRASRRWARRRRPGPEPSAVQDKDAMCSSSSVTLMLLASQLHRHIIGPNGVFEEEAKRRQDALFCVLDETGGVKPGYSDVFCKRFSANILGAD